MNDFETELISQVVEKFGLNEQQRIADILFSDMGIDSLSLAEIIFFLEDKYQISFEVSDFSNTPQRTSELISSIRNIVKFKSLNS